MAVLRADIERALDELVSNEEGMRFQGLAVVLGRQRWPELIACERKKDLGLDAYGSASLAPDKIGKGLASSITPELQKISSDARKAKQNFSDLSVLIFVTAGKMGNKKKIDWAAAIRKTHGLDLHIVSREDVITSLMLPANASLCVSFLGIAIAVEPVQAELIVRIRQAARDLAVEWATRQRGRPVIPLSSVRLDLGSAESAEVFSLGQILEALGESRRIVLEAPAGRGKTTTLIELAKEHAAAHQTAFLIDLPAWTASGLGILEYIAGMPSCRVRAIEASALARAQATEHISFLLNGWNEIAESSSLQALHKLRELDRAFPAAGIIVATRTHHIAPPLPGAVRLRLLTLTSGQRTAYLRARLGNKAAELQPRLEADPVLDELTRVPFILSEVASIFEHGAPIPNTKMGVLGSVLRLLEEAPEHRNELRLAPLYGCQAEYLRALASEMTSQGAVTLTDEAARVVARAVGQALADRGLLGAVPEPATVLATLTAHHVLERIEYPAVAVRFEHQQFQEHYAAVGVQARLFELDAANGDVRRAFTTLYVNCPAWSEPLRMIADMLGVGAGNKETREENARAGRLLVDMALSVDPVLAAELTRLCGEEVRKELGGVLAARLRGWYGVRDENHRQCALAAMLASGSSEFQDIVVPLLSGEDEQTRLKTYRMWPLFQVSSLGMGWQDRVRGWSEAARAEFVAEVLRQRLVPEIVTFAIADPSVRVKKAAAISLCWTGADEEATKVLDSMDAASFGQTARELSPDLLPEGVRRKTMANLRELLDSAADAWERLGTAMKLIELGERTLEEPLKNSLNALPAAEVRTHGQHLVRSAIDQLRQRDPGWVSEWVAARIADHTLWPDHWIALVGTVPKGLADTILRRLENENLEHRPLDGIIALLRLAATDQLAGRVFSRLRTLRATVLAAPDQRHDLEWAIERQLETLFRALPVNVAIAGLLAAVAGPPDRIDIHVVTRLLTRGARSDLEPITSLDPALKAALRDYLKRSTAVVLAEDDFSGELKANLSSAIAQVGEPADMVDLVTLIRADIERMTKGRAARAAGDRGPRGNGASMSYALWHLVAAIDLDRAGAADVLIELLPEAHYTESVAEAMVRSTSTPVKPFGGDESRYRDHWDAREGRLQPPAHTDERKRYAAALAEHVRRLLDDRKDTWRRASTYTLSRLANALAALDGGGFPGLVLEVISLQANADHWQCVEAAERLLSSGVVLPHAATVALLDAVAEHTKKYGSSDQERWLTIRCLSLLPFTDDPTKGIERLRQVLAKAPFTPYECRGVIAALGEGRSDAALEALRDMVSDQKNLEHYDEMWIKAVARLDTPGARDLLLSFIDPDVPGVSPGIDVRHHGFLAASIAEIAGRFPNVEARLRRLAERELPPLKRSRLAAVLKVIGTPETLAAGLQLIHDRVHPAVPRDTFEHLETAFVEHRPYGQSENTYTLVARASNETRRTLFEMVTTDDRRKESAFSLLGQIEVWRLEYGRPAMEPRHPALDSGQPWPPNEPVA